ncbi:hypothetical protein BT96DRAFT_1007064 [Gymnopus androsaceus JB14]|uniref:Uncharacterized protein n=1 Tax=Gymnopus androsaceus JB14 TaxID=1447944 RepID=A0A6A4GJH7_9AGAR|nr:hypothetical protein BT96DRAFT_1007064 [Gymnopus androsaceus JB14]
MLPCISTSSLLVAADASSSIPSSVPSSVDTSAEGGTAVANSEGSTEALPKRKKGALGPVEKKIACAATAATSKKITEAVRYIEEVDQLVKNIAKEHKVSQDCMCQLAGQVLAIKNKKGASNWNVLVHFKGQELNDGHTVGNKLCLLNIHAAIHKDADMMDILNSNGKHMLELRQQYKDKKEEEKKNIMQCAYFYLFSSIDCR